MVMTGAHPPAAAQAPGGGDGGDRATTWAPTVIADTAMGVLVTLASMACAACGEAVAVATFACTAAAEAGDDVVMRTPMRTLPAATVTETALTSTLAAVATAVAISDVTVGV